MPRFFSFIKHIDYQISVPEHIDLFMMTVLDYIENQKPHHRALLYELHSLILAVAPNAKVSLKWKVPFYTLQHDVCYLTVRGKGVALGFVRGHRLTTTQSHVTGQDKMYVRHLIYFQTDDIDADTFAKVMEEAILLDEN